MTHLAPTLTLMSFNLDHDGGEPEDDGTPPEAWRAAHEEIARHRPDVLARQELTHSQSRPGDSPHAVAAADQRFSATQRVLGMKGFRAPMGLGRNPTGAFVREETLTATHVPHRLHWRTPPTTLTLTLPELPHIPITLWSVHLAFNSRHQRYLEADNASTLVDRLKLHHDRPPTGAAWIVGDMNSYPVPDGETVPPIDWSTVSDRAHRHHRAAQPDDGTWESCTHMDRTMHDMGMQDAARWVAHRLGTPSALSPTAGRPDQGGPARIDRAYLDPWTVQAVEHVEVIDMTGISDHHAVLVTLSRDKLIETLHRRTTHPAHLTPGEPISRPRHQV
ncbi:endonuclease/exonuclease/phosphatase family protein [Streptomyces sp. NPDC004610]|uniref:endonuclease/exonuclease/phosphatase family protein n=1 Tax=unclassified Streptomyces TaxID=2593676 RepID=UPI0033AB2060